MLVYVQSGSPFILQVPAACGGQGYLRSSLWSCRVESVISTLVSVLILLAGYFDHPQSHLRNGFTCWSRCSVEALANFRCQVLVWDKKGALRSYWRAWRVVYARLTLASKLILFVVDLVRTRSHMSSGCICWSRCRIEALANCRCHAVNGKNTHCFIIVGPDQG